MKNKIQNSFYDVVDKALLGLKRSDYINEATREKILNTLREEIYWD